MTQQVMFPSGPSEADTIRAKCYAAAMGWRFVGWTEHRDLFGGMSWEARFTANGETIYRTAAMLAQWSQG